MKWQLASAKSNIIQLAGVCFVVLLSTAEAQEELGGSVSFSEQPSIALRATLQALAVPAPVPTVFNTDFVSAGVGAMRDQPGPHFIDLAGVGGSAISKALLYWHGPTNSSDSLANANVVFNGAQVTGTNIGFSADNCWGFLNSQSYVADVTPFVTGDGVYTLEGFGFGPVNTNGASLVVFFNDGDPTNNRDVSIFQGNDSNISNPFDPPGWNVTLSGIQYAGGAANMQLHIADGQDFVDDALRINSVEKIPLGNWVTGFSVPGINNGPANNGRLWDIINVDVTDDLVTAGSPPQSLSLTTGIFFDCLALVAAIVDLPQGAAPGNVAVDIKPGSDTNPVNLKSNGMVTVAILGSGQFDVTTVNGATLEFHAPGGAAPAHNLAHSDQFVGHLEDVNADGIADLVSHYRTQETGLSPGDTEGCVSGMTLGGMSIFGCDAVQIVGDR